MISSWYSDRGLPVPPSKYLPTTGFIVEDVACGFLFKTDSAFAILDAFVSNPKEKKTKRNNALDMITTLLLLEAKNAGYDLVKADTKHDVIKFRCIKHGFISTGKYYSYAKEI